MSLTSPSASAASRKDAGTTGGAPAPPSSELSDRCPGLVAYDRPRVIPASFDLAALADGEVRLTYVGHSTFLIESPRLVRIATDYNDSVRPPVLPDIVTMNHAHDTHFSDHPDPAIQYVLRGWGPSPDERAIWDLKYRDVRVRNVPTNIRTWSGNSRQHELGPKNACRKLTTMRRSCGTEPLRARSRSRWRPKNRNA